MGSGRIVFIAFVVSALTSAGTFFGLRAIVAKTGASTASGGAAPPSGSAAARAGGGASGAGAATKSSNGGGGGGPRSTPAARTVNVPLLHGKKLSAAMKALLDAGLGVGKITRRDDKTLAKDLVIATAPPAGTPLLGGGKVNLVVSNGTTEVAVPRVVGMRVAGARSKLRAAGFKVHMRYKYDEDKMEGVILGQTPRRDAKAAPGSTVTIIVNRE